jgi:hypothetical protein
MNIMFRAGVRLRFTALLIGSQLGCGAGPDPSAIRNRTFYEYGRLGGEATAAAYERPFPPLNLDERRYVGVQVLDGAVRFSRPSNWVIRSASLEPQKRFIEYVSPTQTIFSVYERVESPRDVWREVMARYESEVTADGGKIIAKPVPVATWNAQGRAFLVERGIAAPKSAFINRSREYLLRSAHRVLLIQFVNQGGDYRQTNDEILPVVESLQVL